MQDDPSDLFGPLRQRAPAIVAGWIWAVLVLLTAVCLFTPFSPMMPASGLDPSWVLGINQAVAQKLVFGRDIVFTFGPYGAIFTKAYHPATDGFVFWSALYLGLSFGVVSVMLLRDAGWLPRMLFLLALWLFSYSNDAIIYAYPLAAGLYAHQIVTRQAGERRPARWTVLALAALFAPFGLLPLVKGSVLVLCGAIAGLLFLQALACGRKMAAIAIAVSPLAAAVFFWLVSGQPLIGLASYVISSPPMITGYTEAMSVDGPMDETVEYIVVAGSLLAILLFREWGRLLRGGSLVMVVFVALFLSFKSGFVRHDGHAVFPAVFLVLAATYLVAIDRSRRAGVAYVASAFVCMAILSHYQTIDPASLKNNLKAIYAPAWQGATARLKGGGVFADGYRNALAQLGAQSDFPRLAGATDVYSFDQAYLIGAGERWDPRPVLQSYAAYTPGLIEMDRRHLIGPGAPDNIFFKPAATDNRLPSLEDGSSWPLLLSNYRVRSMAGDYLVLGRAAQQATPSLVSLGQQMHLLGETVPVPSSDGVLFAKVDIAPNIFGRIANLLFKSSQLHIGLTLADGEVRTYRIISGMTASGFVLSPVVSDGREALMLYANSDYLAGHRVKTFVIDPNFGRRLWKRQYRIEFFRLAAPRNPSLAPLLQFDAPYAPSSGVTIGEAAHCDGAIDAVNGVNPPPSDIRGVLDVRGWLSPSTDRGELGDKVLVVMTDAQGRRTFYGTNGLKRPDVAAVFKKPALDQTGFETTADISALKGAATLGLAYQKAGAIEICPQFKIAESLN